MATVLEIRKVLHEYGIHSSTIQVSSMLHSDLSFPRADLVSTRSPSSATRPRTTTRRTTASSSALPVAERTARRTSAALLESRQPS